MMDVRITDEQARTVSNVLVERVMKIDFDLGDCNNEQVAKELRAERNELLVVIGAIQVAKS